MPLENDVQALTAAVTKLTERLGSGGAPDGTTPRPPGRPKGSPNAPKPVSLDEVKAVAKKLMDEKGRPVAVKLIQEHGAAQLAELDTSKYAAFIAAAEVLLAAEPEPAEATDDL